MRTSLGGGGPVGSMEDRGQRRHDPSVGTPMRWKILHALHRHRQELANGEMRYHDIAAEIGTSTSYLRIVKNSAWGKGRLRRLASNEPKITPSNVVRLPPPRPKRRGYLNITIPED